jgi:hypothetical protein
MTKAEPDHNFDVTPDSGYETEAKVRARNSNGWGGTQTRLPEGHLARRDTVPVAKNASEYAPMSGQQPRAVDGKFTASAKGGRGGY